MKSKDALTGRKVDGENGMEHDTVAYATNAK